MIVHIADEELVRRLREGITQRDGAGAGGWDWWWCQRAQASVYWMTEDLVDPDERDRARRLLDEHDSHPVRG